MTIEQVDVLVVTALKLERLAVRQHLNDVAVERNSTLAADIGSSISRPSQRIAVIETGPGNVGAGLLAARAEEAFRPRYVLMVGIAGGIKDVSIGDVVASSKVYWVEGGKVSPDLRPRPEFAAVSGELLQLARAVATDARWVTRSRVDGGRWPGAERPPTALVAPIVVGEKVVADRASEAARLIADSYSDAVAVDMEDFGALRGGAASERAKVIAIRGVSDLLSEKTEADARGSQPLAAANAAAFLFDLLDRLPASEAAERSHPRDDSRPASHQGFDVLLRAGRELYPEGPNQDGLWERAGGDPARLRMDGPGATRWWNAVRTLKQGGGGGNITLDSLVAQMRTDYPGNDSMNLLG